MKLYTYFRSSAAWRVRIAMALKGLDYEPIPIHLRRGEQLSDDYRRLNPIGEIPTLVTDDGVAITQSLAIVDYLEERYPSPTLLPFDPVMRARARAIALTIVADIHPVDNLRVLNYLSGTMSQPKSAIDAWYAHWITVGFGAVEALLAEANPAGAGYAVGDAPGFADLCIVPQVRNAVRFGVDLEPFSRVRTVNDRCLEHPAFSSTAPETQPDFEPGQ